MRTQRGFTLIELIIVIVILGILGTLAGGMLQIGFDSWSNSMTRSSDSVDAMTVMRYFYRVIPKAVPATITKATKFRFVFSETEGKRIKIKYQKNAQLVNIKIGNNELHKITGVTSFNWTYAKVDRAPWTPAMSRSLIRRVQLDLTAAQKDYSFNYFIRNE